MLWTLPVKATPAHTTVSSGIVTDVMKSHRYELRTAHRQALNGSAGELPQGAICAHPAVIIIWMKSEYEPYRINATVD